MEAKGNYGRTTTTSFSLGSLVVAGNKLLTFESCQPDCCPCTGISAEAHDVETSRQVVQVKRTLMVAQRENTQFSLSHPTAEQIK